MLPHPFCSACVSRRCFKKGYYTFSDEVIRETSVKHRFAAARPTTTVFKLYTAEVSAHKQANKPERLVVGRRFKNQICDLCQFGASLLQNRQKTTPISTEHKLRQTGTGGWFLGADI